MSELAELGMKNACPPLLRSRLPRMIDFPHLLPICLPISRFGVPPSPYSGITGGILFDLAIGLAKRCAAEYGIA